ncbi:hypothetical protein FRC0434_02155 [Corynebacterium diphtheriae]|nr:hypothetical protein FRC0435_02156 [Corynebacterium diphtheriae]CAB0932770.1 hypothetical protein FRC0434_02155 [Corynebacterium diphtheriae]
MGVWWPFTPVGVLNDAAVAVNAATEGVRCFVCEALIQKEFH